MRGLELKESLYVCDRPPSLGTQSGSAAGGALTDSRYENFTWTGTLAPFSKKPGGAQLTIRASDRLGDPNFRPIAQVPIDDLTSPPLRAIAERIVGNFVASYRPPR